MTDGASAQDAAQASATLTPLQSSLVIQAPKDSATGYLQVTLMGVVAPGEVTLRASPLSSGGNYAFLRFSGSNSDIIKLDAAGLRCSAGGSCVLAYEVYRAWADGPYQGSIDALTPTGTIGTTPVTALRLAPSFRPVITSDAMKDGHLVFDATDMASFLLTVQNPAGAPPGRFSLSVPANDPACAGKPPIGFTPPDFQLQPGAAQTVIAKVEPCLPAQASLTVLRIADGNQPAVWTETVMSVSKFAPVASRRWLLFLFVILGSIVSVLLNNIFPVSRAKNALRSDLRRVGELLRDCANTGPALLDRLTAEATRLRLSLQRISFVDASKLSAIQGAQGAVAELLTAATLARKISLTRSKVDGATLSIATHAAIRGRLRDAEEALQGGDAAAAADRLGEAQAKLTAAIADVEQAALRDTIKAALLRMLRAHGKLVDLPPAQPAAGQPAAGQAAAQGGPKWQLIQPSDRNPRIKDIVLRLFEELSVLEEGALTPQEVLDIERDFYIAEIWTEYVEPKLEVFQDVALKARLPAFERLAEALLDCLLHNPKSDHAQILLDLVRSDTTPVEIAAALEQGKSRIECDPHPRHFESVDIAFRFTDPLLDDVAAARRLLSYAWSIDDGTTPPPDVDRFNHYFLPRRRLPVGKGRQATAYAIQVTVTVPFADGKSYGIGPQTVTPRGATRDWYKLSPMEVASFTISAAIAVVTAFGIHYSDNLPSVLTFSDFVSSFMLGFGLDQLRDTVGGPAAAVPPAAPAAQQQPAPPPHA